MSPVRKRPRGLSRKSIRQILSGFMFLFVLSTGAVMSFLLWKGYHSIYVQPMVYAPPPSLNFRAARKIYPFSIIPGGVYDPLELAQNIRLVPSLAEHYRDLRMDNLIAVRTQAPMHAYVSFRHDGQIYWTSKELTIPRGELVLTDGRHMIRSRCGNRIEQTRPVDVIRSSVITEQMEDLILDAPLPSIARLPPSLQPVVSPGVLVGDIWKGPNSELSAVPEPDTLFLFASGLLIIVLTVGRYK